MLSPYIMVSPREKKPDPPMSHPPPVMSFCTSPGGSVMRTATVLLYAVVYTLTMLQKHPIHQGSAMVSQIGFRHRVCTWFLGAIPGIRGLTCVSRR